MTPLDILQQDIVCCERCPRLVQHRLEVARTKRRAYADWSYWGKPVPSFGDPAARLLIIGLAPGAHGANRTGRMFTGDRSGEFLFRAMYETGFASQPTSTHGGDGLHLSDAYITAAVRCAPPGNKPAVDEIRECRNYLLRELALLPNTKVIVALGRLAFDAYLSVTRQKGHLFAHHRRHDLGPNHPALISSYHPSQQNTQTGKLTQQMLQAVFLQARSLL